MVVCMSIPPASCTYEQTGCFCSDAPQQSGPTGTKSVLGGHSTTKPHAELQWDCAVSWGSGMGLLYEYVFEDGAQQVQRSFLMAVPLHL